MDENSAGSFVFHKFSQTLAVIPPPVKKFCSVRGLRHPEQHPQAGEECPVWEDLVLAAALRSAVHQSQHQVEGCRARFVVTAVYSRASPIPAKLRCYSFACLVPDGIHTGTQNKQQQQESG